MSRITRISATNLKGRTFGHDLAPVTVVLGKNFAGKTSVLTAMKLALLGYDPKRGKLQNATFNLAGCPKGGATSMSVRAVLSEGATIDRLWEMKNGKVSYTGGDKSYIPAMLLDPKTYFSMTGPARLNYVLSQCDLAKLGIGLDPLLEKIQSGIQPENDHERAALAELEKLVSESWNEDEVAGVSVYDCIDHVVTILKDGADKASSRAGTHAETIRGLTANKSSDGMDMCQSVQPRIDDAKSRLEVAIRNAQTLSDTCSRITKEIDGQRKLANQYRDPSVLDATIKEQEDIISSLITVPPPGETPAMPELPPKPSNEHARKVEREAVERLSDIQRRVYISEHNVAEIVSSIDAAQKQTCCPTCGQDTTTINAEVVAKLRVKLDAATAQEVELRAGLNAAKSAVYFAQNDMDVATQAIKQWDAKAAEVRSKHDLLIAHWVKRSNDYSTALSSINNAKEIIANRVRVKEQNQVFAAAAKRVKELEVDQTGFAKELTEAVAVKHKIEAELSELNFKQRQFVARMQDQKRADQSQAELDAATSESKVYKLALRVVDSEKKRVSVDAFTDLLAHARRFTDGILKAPLEYRDGDLGMVYDGNWFTHKEFSGVEEQLAFAGLSVALTQREDMAVRIVLMDELGLLDPENFRALLSRMLDLTEAGVIDQFVGCAPTQFCTCANEDFVKVIFIE